MLLQIPLPQHHFGHLSAGWMQCHEQILSTGFHNYELVPIEMLHGITTNNVLKEFTQGSHCIFRLGVHQGPVVQN